MAARTKKDTRSAFEKAVDSHNRAQERIDRAKEARDKAFARALAAAEKEGVPARVVAKSLGTSLMLVLEHRFIARYGD